MVKNTGVQKFDFSKSRPASEKSNLHTVCVPKYLLPNNIKVAFQTVRAGGIIPVHDHPEHEFFIGAPNETGKIGGYGAYSRAIYSCGLVRHVEADMAHGGKGQGTWASLKFEDPSNYSIYQYRPYQAHPPIVRIAQNNTRQSLFVGSSLLSLPKTFDTIGFNDTELYFAPKNHLQDLPNNLHRYISLES
jgi:hypothetical protein